MLENVCGQAVTRTRAKIAPSVVLGVVKPVRAHRRRRNVVARRPKRHVLLSEGFLRLGLRLS